ncbi:hypothetical protein C1701_02230 [Actinoalloteichus sp. AHMU CJ021]|nr:hypothetical protein C1701_02230 [Actinoalloteichus sp. AHMU CJ021]
MGVVRWGPTAGIRDPDFVGLRRARLVGLVADLADGLDTVVGERGYRFSRSCPARRPTRRVPVAGSSRPRRGHTGVRVGAGGSGWCRAGGPWVTGRCR